MSISTLRLGIIGAGANTRRFHIPGFQAIDGVDVVAVANRTLDSAQRVADAMGIAEAKAHWEEIIADKTIDAVCVGTWPNMHAEITLAALQAGKHVLTEARMARNLPEAEAMLAAAQAHPDRITQIVPAPMSLEFDATINRFIAEGRLGAIREINVTVTHGGFANPDAPFTWRQDQEISGYNMLFLGIYHEMVMRWLGERDPVRVIADGAVYTRERKDEQGAMSAVKIPESITVIARWPDHIRTIYHMSGVETTTPRDEIRINGSAGCLRLALAQKQLFFAPLGGPETLVAFPEQERRGWRVEADFIESIRKGTPVKLTSFADGVRYMRFTQDVWQALA